MLMLKICLEQRSEEILKRSHHRFEDGYSNVTVWVFPSNENRIECIYNGKNEPNDNNKVSSLLKEIDLKSEVLLNSETKEEFQANMRDMKINGILDDD